MSDQAEQDVPQSPTAEERLAADSALEPELAHERDAAARAEAEDAEDEDAEDGEAEAAE